MIEVKNLGKTYKIVKKDPGIAGALKSLFIRKHIVKKAVNEINFRIKKGEMVGYIGTNGAGKSTTIKMLTGILTPTTGSVLVNGIEPYKNRQINARNIGAVFGQRTQLFWDIPVIESFDLLKHIYKISDEVYEDNLKTFTELLDLSPLLHIPVRQLSLGQKMRCELAAAFLHNPSIVYLDEPTIGLDVSVKHKIRKFIKEMNKKLETTVILTTHDMQDIEEIASRIIVIDQGKILFDGSSETIKAQFGSVKKIDLKLDQENEFVLSKEIENYVKVKRNKNDYDVQMTFENKDIATSNVLKHILDTNNVADITITDTSIEEIVKELYERGN